MTNPPESPVNRGDKGGRDCRGRSEEFIVTAARSLTPLQKQIRTLALSDAGPAREL